MGESQARGEAAAGSMPPSLWPYIAIPGLLASGLAHLTYRDRRIAGLASRKCHMMACSRRTAPKNRPHKLGVPQDEESSPCFSACDSSRRLP